MVGMAVENGDGRSENTQKKFLEEQDACRNPKTADSPKCVSRDSIRAHPENQGLVLPSANGQECPFPVSKGRTGFPTRYCLSPIRAHPRDPRFKNPLLSNATTRTQPPRTFATVLAIVFERTADRADERG